MIFTSQSLTDRNSGLEKIAIFREIVCLGDNLMSQSYQYLRQHLPREIFKPFHFQLLPIIAVWLLGACGIAVIATQNLPWYGNLVLSLAIGYCWAIGGLFGHELMHGSVVRNKTIQNGVGFFCFLPYLISPTFWRYWHNNLHHSHTQRTLLDPDAYPTLRIFKQSKFTQWMYPFTPGSGTKRSLMYFFFWFSVNVQVVQFYLRFRNKNFNKLNHKRVNIELALAFVIHVSALFFISPSLWLFTTLIPFLFMNYLPFSYISTNHNLSPLTSKNDPLVNTLTVTNHPILEFFHIHFGYHVEHHMFPTVAGVHLKKVHNLLKSEFPDQFQYMPKWKAMVALYKTPRIYKDSKTLVHPLTGETKPTLGVKKVSVSDSESAVKEHDKKLQTPELELDRPAFANKTARSLDIGNPQ